MTSIIIIFSAYNEHMLLNVYNYTKITPWGNSDIYTSIYINVPITFINNG